MRRAAKRDISEKPRAVMDFVCETCGGEFRRRTTIDGKHFCSTECRYKGMGGSKNPNYREHIRTECLECGQRFKKVHSARKFCSMRCYADNRRIELIGPPAPPKPKKIRIKRIGRSPVRVRIRYGASCPNCDIHFTMPPSAKKRGRKYCSYSCFVADGGPVRAGTASAEAIMKKYGAKKDANHKEIMDYLTQFVAVADISHCGYGVPDGVAYIKDGWQLFDIKNPKTSYGRRGLNDRQKRFMSDWRGGPVYLIYNEDDAKNFVEGKFDKLKSQRGGGYDEECEREAS